MPPVLKIAALFIYLFIYLFFGKYPAKFNFTFQNPASFNQICKILCIPSVILFKISNSQSTSMYFNPFI